MMMMTRPNHEEDLLCNQSYQTTSSSLEWKQTKDSALREYQPLLFPFKSSLQKRDLRIPSTKSFSEKRDFYNGAFWASDTHISGKW